MATNRAGDEVDLTTWIGRTESTRDVVAPTPVAALHATLDHPVEAIAGRHGAAAPLALAVLPADAPAERTSAPTATPSAAASCRRCRCRGACGPAASSSSARRSASAIASPARRPSTTCRPRKAAPASSSSSRCATRCAATARPTRRWSSSTTSSIAKRKRPGDVAPPPQAAPAERCLAARDRARRRAAVPLLGADLQRPPHPLRPPVRDRGRGLSRPDRARSADRHAADGPAAAQTRRTPTSRRFRFKAVRPTFDLQPVPRQRRSRRPTARPSGSGPRTTRAG